jgi:hypothetical protein
MLNGAASGVLAQDPARSGGMGSQRRVLLACHLLHQGYWGGAPGYVIDHEGQVPFGRYHAMVVCALIAGRRVVVGCSGDGGIGSGADRAARHKAGLEGGRVGRSGELEQVTSMLSPLVLLS